MLVGSLYNLSKINELYILNIKMNALNLWSEDEEIKLLGEISWGLSIENIAHRHGRSTHAIYKRLEKIAQIMLLKDVPKYIIKIKTRVEFTDCENRKIVIINI